MTDDKTTEALLQSDDNNEVESVNTPNEDPSDRLTADHPRFKEVLERAKTAETKSEEYERELAKIKEQMEDLQKEVNQKTADGDQQLSDDQIESLNVIERHLRSKKFITTEELEQREAVERRNLEFKRLNSEYTGTDGYPKFVAVDVTEYAKKNGYGDNLEPAYFAMHREAIARVDAKKMADGTLSVPRSEYPASGDRSPQSEVTVEDVKNMSDADYEKHREQLLTKFKASVK